MHRELESLIAPSRPAQASAEDVLGQTNPWHSETSADRLQISAQTLSSMGYDALDRLDACARPSNQIASNVDVAEPYPAEIRADTHITIANEVMHFCRTVFDVVWLDQFSIRSVMVCSLFDWIMPFIEVQHRSLRC